MALREVDFTLLAAEVHGLVGGNGAGKSTLMKVLAGALPDYEGTVLMSGQPVPLGSPQAAMAHGIAMVYQELSGIGQLTVAENLFLGRQPTTRLGRIDWRTIYRTAAEWLADLQIEVDVTRRLDHYPLVVRQMVEIARGIHSGAKVLILDEPTSALSPPETRRLFELIERLRQRGVAIVFISHFLEDVLEICDRVTILRDGRHVETAETDQLDKHDVIQKMLGHRLEAEKAGYEGGVRLPPRSSTPPVLTAVSLSLTGVFADLDLQVSPGECLGIYGFVGCGHQELVQALAGARRATSGRVLVDGRLLKAGDPHDAVRRGMVLVAGDRARSLFMKAEIYKNVTLAHLRRAAGRWLIRRREIGRTVPILHRVGCRPADPRLPAGSLSGGNQQKVVIAKWLLGEVRILLLDEPTRGMDVAAKEEVMRLVGELKQQGAAVVLCSAEPELLLAHADRILVMSRGRATHEFVDTEVDKAALMRYGQGLKWRED